MKAEWIDWIVDYSDGLDWKYTESKPGDELDRRYSWCVLSRDKVPFDNELDGYIRAFIGEFNYVNTGYTLVKYNVGDYIGEHADYTGNNKVTYIRELKASDCGTGLTVEGTPLTECYFYNNVIHEVKPIKAGTRISLTMFGSKVTSLI